MEYLKAATYSALLLACVYYVFMDKEEWYDEQLHKIDLRIKSLEVQLELTNFKINNQQFDQKS